MMRKMSRMLKNSERGLTLLEMLVSSLILIIVASAGYASYSAMSQVTRDRADHLYAVDLARNQITAVKKSFLIDGASPTTLEKLECSTIGNGSCILTGISIAPEDNTNLNRLVYSSSSERAKMLTKLYQNDATGSIIPVPSNAKAFQVAVSVLWKDVRGNDKSESLTTYLYKP